MGQVSDPSDEMLWNRKPEHLLHQAQQTLFVDTQVASASSFVARMAPAPNPEQK